MRTVYFDVDTQYDFLLPSGALYVPGAEHVISRISALNRHAAANRIPLVSTTDAHSENDAEFSAWPPHCIVGTMGQRKPESTLLSRRTVVSSKLERINVEGFEQIILEKQNIDCFTNPNLPALLEALKGDHYVVYGVATEVCVQCAAFGLLGDGRRVEIVADAVRHLDQSKANQMFQEFRLRGGYVI